MKYTTAQMMHCLKLRAAQYEKAIAMNSGTIPKENGFIWPSFPGTGPYAPENLYYWRGALAELQNTIHMLEA